MVTEDQSDVIAFLDAPGSYGAGVAGVSRIETHTAMVFLAGDRAYKLKRAVRYDYLDFSTAERRRAACHDEVALNRRTAPQIYLGVLAVTREAGGGLALDGSGPPVDWLVHMVRFEQSALLNAMAARGELEAAVMADLGAGVARLHASADRRTDQGGREGMSWVIEGNAYGFGAEGSGILDPDLCARVTDGSRRALARHDAVLESRRRDGFVRVCHGDLHLRNIVMLDGRPVPFDAVEFNDRISCIDVWYDTAFLLMDLWRLDLRRHANELLNAYAGETGDLAGLALLPLFLSCRSAVRAKTSATSARLQTDPSRAAGLRSSAQRYLADAERLLDPGAARLIAVGGLSGSGKSTLARALGPEVGAPPGALILRSDLVRKQIAGVPATQRLPAEAYTREMRGEVYDHLAAQAATVLAAGHTVIVDAVFAESDERARFARLAEAAGVPFSGLWLVASDAEMVSRIGARQADASDATVEVLRAQQAREVGAMDWTAVDAGGAPEAVLRRAAVELSRSGLSRSG